MSLSLDQGLPKRLQDGGDPSEIQVLGGGHPGQTRCPTDRVNSAARPEASLPLDAGLPFLPVHAFGPPWRVGAPALVQLGTTAAARRTRRTLVAASVKRKLKELERSFVPGVNRDEVYAAEEVLGLPLDEFIAVAIAGLQQVAPDIGL